MESVGFNNLKLTGEEKDAKDFLLHLFKEGDQEPCDVDLVDFEAKLPNWYNDAKYKRAQIYFSNNRAGIFGSNMVSLISLLAQDKGLQLLCSTGRSSTADTARKRYVSTILHTLCWYEYDLTPGSKSWESLMRVRKMHLNASRSAEKKKIGNITQTEMTITQFGFMGFALVRPHIFGVDDNSEDDIEAFIHLWAVLGYMLGIKDEYNIGLLPVNVVKVLSQTILRYFMLPAVQLESPKFKTMTLALLNGLEPLVPHMSYELQMFVTKRAACIPGYQYSVDYDKEILSRSIFTEDEIRYFLKECAKTKGYEYMQFVLSPKVPVFNFIKNAMVTEVNGNIVSHKTNVPEDVIVENRQKRPMDPAYAERLREYLGLDENTSIILSLIDYETEWKVALNDSKFSELSTGNQRKMGFREKMRRFAETWVGHHILDWLVSLLMWRLRHHLNST